MYIYTPGEPAGVPYQPGPDIDQQYLFSNVDLFTRGRCGGCRACPPVWRLYAPPGYTSASTYAGNYYLRRLPYQYANSGQDPTRLVCSWTSRTAWDDNYCPISDANHNDYIYGGTDDIHGWILKYALVQFPDTALTPKQGWFLRTPIHDNNGKYEGSWYMLQRPSNRFRCLAANTFTYYARAAEFAFPYRPFELTITPFYA